MISAKINVNLSRYEVEIKARKYGMEYRDEQKVIPKSTDKNSNNKDVKK
ncbi:hypothetical protein RBU49_03605 [Clostridium sp. MB40-C1]|nr:hypothetical protein [Clostridium sp. MB40-C1]WMJ81354.1 hypothetical protein RBU49_03605 [Clostridium sp. MB40-C1]